MSSEDCSYWISYAAIKRELLGKAGLFPFFSYLDIEARRASIIKGEGRMIIEISAETTEIDWKTVTREQVLSYAFCASFFYVLLDRGWAKVPEEMTERMKALVLSGRH